VQASFSHPPVERAEDFGGEPLGEVYGCLHLPSEPRPRVRSDDLRGAVVAQDTAPSGIRQVVMGAKALLAGGVAHFHQSSEPTQT
jgi:hypothetical protein